MIRMLALPIAAAAVLLGVPTLAQPTSTDPLDPPPNGPKRGDPDFHVIAGATVHTAPGQTLEQATVVMRDGRIAAVRDGADARAEVEAGATLWDGEGLHVYAGFIDAFAEVDAPSPHDDAPGRHWNPFVTPERHALDGTGLPESEASRLRGLGFAAAAISPRSGIFRGRSAVVSTGARAEDRSLGRPPVYRADAYHAMSLERSPRRSGDYPTSMMGAAALIRQTLLDAAWAETNRGEDLPARDAFSAIIDHRIPLAFDVSTELEALVASDIRREFANDMAPFDLIIIGSGTEYRRLHALAGDGHPIVVPLRFPPAPNVSSVGHAESVELHDLMAWEHAPANAARLADAGLTVAITSARLPRGQTFHDNLRRAVRAGLGERGALAALTTSPAEILGVGDRLGRVERGFVASLVVADGPLFEDGSKILEVWTEGRRHEISPRPAFELEGEWALTLAGRFELGMTVGADGRITLHEGDEDGERRTSRARRVEREGTRLSFTFEHEPFGMPGVFVMSAVTDGGMLAGTGMRPDGHVFSWTGVRAGAGAGNDDAEANDDTDEPAPIPELPGYPFGPYAERELPREESVLIWGATIWTSGPDGTIEDGYMLVEGGRIVEVGPAPSGRETPEGENGVRVIDGEGLHVTPGLIDAHSHTGLFRAGVNEGGSAVTAEVRIADALDPGFIGWYRQLAGGVTTVNSLHGSANPIGGQSQTHKVRWGVRRPSDMRMRGARPGIKFALGENVKQSNWGDRFTGRYPQTRMGVETLIRDRFIAAQEYLRDPDRRRDLELEAIAEVLEGERLIHCHSYRQDEILMLARMAEEFGIRIGSFQHGLEVYKVADAVKDTAIGASLFSDWWAYKVEVQDAIPHAGPIQHEIGLNTSYNSDSDELARRMNLEAAKAEKYSDGRVSPEEALRFVTINPAMQLGIEGRVGSLEPGKDADFVVWSGDPLSSFSRVLSTWIDGREYYSVERDREHRERIARERRRLIQKALGAEDGAEDTEWDGAPAEPERRRDLAAFYRRAHEHGIDPETMEPGDCGCAIIDFMLDR